MALLTARNIRHNFGGLRAIDDFNLDLHQGELMGLIGPNGAGKTTVFNLITGVYRASEGSIRYRDEELVGRTPHEITARRIARTFQNIRLFRDLSVLDNVRIAHFSQSRYSPIEALLHAGRFRREEKRIIGHSRDLLAIFKLEHLAGETASSLPYGHQRRLEIARALATRPELLLLDEPAAGLNSTEKLGLRDLLKRISERGLTILIIDHDMTLVSEVAQSITVLNFGRRIADGGAADVLRNPDVIAAYLGSEPDVPSFT